MNDLTALYKIGYGLYVVTTNDGTRDNGCIVNTVCQVTDVTPRVMVTLNKSTHSCDTVLKTGVMNVNCLTVNAPFSVFEKFGFKSGKTFDKFNDTPSWRAKNGILVLSDNINSYFSLKVENTIDLDSHVMFICTVTNGAVINDDESMTYSYYHKNVKQKPSAKKGYVCKICGYVYEGEPLPPDFVCPLCKHGAQDFEKIK